MADEEYPPTVANLLAQQSLRWILVGGKGGVGKTTTSCSLALLLSKHRSRVLLISTDPAHNLSDAFRTKIGSEPTRITETLDAMEVKASVPKDVLESDDGAGLQAMLGKFEFPGADELFAISHVMKLAASMEYDTVVLDTAPTGHTLRFLQLPETMDNFLNTFTSGPMGGMLTQLMGANGEHMERINEMKTHIRMAKTQFTDPDLTTFVCVCIPEFLSVYETERLIQELTENDIDVQNIVVNQVVRDPPAPCTQCAARIAMQGKYLGQIADLYDDFHVSIIPLLQREVRGIPDLTVFGSLLLHPESTEPVLPEQE
ncbi:ATPase get3 [Thecamonas trahens ATCC 50062]|uniref:ATPase get3 n=1 Tax=Thecamonas trahens ATCC 50062 TaxID=461836 RepID=A0A0L0D3C5_THETB|nr:ATPase get3 [Thecamonas trahens ATCC 50062]KNC46809.1 ATPase get3 [Thecamonas trahens ATCC 50062]|eukprot:XP_013760084.1 ATPase get3 [Thecamonas trahens ATCC 50062]